MDWLRSWVTTPEQRCTEAIQKMLEKGALSESEWSTMYEDVTKPDVPASLIKGLPGLMEAMQLREPVVLITVCHLLTLIAKAASHPAHAAALIEADCVPTIFAQWRKETQPELVVEIFACLRNLVVLPKGGEDLLTRCDQALERLCGEMSSPVCSKIEARIHLLALLANLTAANDYAAFQLVQRGYLAPLSQKFASTVNRFAIAVVYNILLWENALQVVRTKGLGEGVQSALVQALGQLLLQPGQCEGKSLEYCLAGRIVLILNNNNNDSGENGGPSEDGTMTPAAEDSSSSGAVVSSFKPITLLWTGQPIFQT